MRTSCHRALQAAVAQCALPSTRAKRRGQTCRIDPPPPPPSPPPPPPAFPMTSPFPPPSALRSPSHRRHAHLFRPARHRLPHLPPPTRPSPLSIPMPRTPRIASIIGSALPPCLGLQVRMLYMWEGYRRHTGPELHTGGMPPRVTNFHPPGARGARASGPGCGWVRVRVGAG
jgi:hypothetical protein